MIAPCIAKHCDNSVGLLLAAAGHVMPMQLTAGGVQRACVRSVRWPSCWTSAARTRGPGTSSSSGLMERRMPGCVAPLQSPSLQMEPADRKEKPDKCLEPQCWVPNAWECSECGSGKAVLTPACSCRSGLTIQAQGAHSVQVREIDVAPDLIHDWDHGMEYAEAEEIERERVFNTERQFLMR